MEINLFDYTIDEIEEKIFDIENHKKDLIADLIDVTEKIDLVEEYSLFDNIEVQKLAKELKKKEKELSSAINYYDSMISIYNEYIYAMQNCFNYNKPHEVYKENAEVLEISKYKKGE